jgi:exodeoxyribonuclease VII large subunit
MEEIVFTPSDFVSVINQTLEYAYPSVIIEGELSNFKVSKNRWVYFDLKDEESSVRFFGTIYNLPGPLEDGLNVRVLGAPHLHQKFGFSVNFMSIQPVGEGSLKKAADLLLQKLEKEGLFAPQRKRILPFAPKSVGLISAAGSAAAADFIKIVNERWGGINIYFSDVLVQGEQAPLQLVSAIEHFNQLSEVPEVLVITRGGGSAEDLAAFNDERVVRAVAASRIPTLVAIGHEIDTSLAELAADMRASTPTNAATILVPDKKHEISILKKHSDALSTHIKNIYSQESLFLKNQRKFLSQKVGNLFFSEHNNLSSRKRLIETLSPNATLRRGYAIIQKDGKYIKGVGSVLEKNQLNVIMADGNLDVKVEKVKQVKR